MVKVLTIVLVIFFVAGANAQNQQLVFYHLTSEQGLSQNHGSAIFQDHKGFMWFGTTDGLNKYDGKKITVYKHNPEDSSGLSNSSIMIIFEDVNKNFWVGTRGGLNLYDRDTDKFVRVPLAKTPNIVYAICEDLRKNLWIASDSGLYLFDKRLKTFHQYFKHIDITALFGDAQGNLWLGSRSHGLYFFNPKINEIKNYPQARVSSILEDRHGNLWISTWGAGLILFDRTKGAFTTSYVNSLNDPKSISKNIIYTTFKDSKGRIWVGTENGGLNLFDPVKGTFERYVRDMRNKNSLSNNSVSAIYEDKTGTIWVGVHRGGINYFNFELEKFKLYEQEPYSLGLNHNNTKAFCEASDGKIWIATDGGGIGVLDLKKDTFTYFKHDPNDQGTIGSDVVLALFEDRQGTMWVGTYLEGLDKYDKKNNRFIHYRHDSSDESSLSNNNVWNIAEDSKGNFWIGTREDGGLNLMDRKSGRFTRYKFDKKNPKSLSHNLVTAIFEDSKKRLWVGTEIGLNLYDPANNNFTRFYANKKRGSLSNNNILCITEDRERRLWIGTVDGLNLFDVQSSTCKVFNTRNGLPNDAIQAMLEDDHNNLWISTSEGISRFNYKSSNVRNYSIADRLQGYEFIQNAAVKTRDGKMIFGGINGFNLFHPDSVRDNIYKPPVYITGFHLFNKPIHINQDSPLNKDISETNRITLSYKESVFSFEFAALNYIHPENNRYAYKMEGFDKEWHYSGTQNLATYTNLNPDTYVFKVKASNNDGIWNETGTSITLIITPPFWNTWWFKSMFILLTVLAIYVTYRTKTYAIKQENKRLEVGVIERTKKVEQQKEEILKNRDELQQLNLKVIKQNEMLEKKVEERTHDLQAMNEELAANDEELRKNLDHTLSINEQLTESRELLKQQNLELHKINAELDHFVYSTSHDLRAPLTSLMGLINVAKMGPLEDLKNTYFEMMEKSVNKLDAFVRDIISYYKNARLEVKVQSIDFQYLFNETFDYLKYIDKSASIEKSLTITGDASFYSDYFRLRIMFNNIICNGIQYSNPMTGNSYIHVRISLQEQKAVIEFEDNGCGISAENVEKVFIMFYRASETSSGSGLGLYIVKETIKTLGGSIQISSKLGEGTTFLIELPNLASHIPV